MAIFITSLSSVVSPCLFQSRRVAGYGWKISGYFFHLQLDTHDRHCTWRLGSRFLRVAILDPLAQCGQDSGTHWLSVGSERRLWRSGKRLKGEFCCRFTRCLCCGLQANDLQSCGGAKYAIRCSTTRTWYSRCKCTRLSGSTGPLSVDELGSHSMPPVCRVQYAAL